MEKHKKLVRVVCLVLAALMVMTIGVPLIFAYAETPAEKLERLRKELDDSLNQIEDLIYRINMTNVHATIDGESLTRLIARRDVLSKRVAIMGNIVNQIASNDTRFGKNEIRFVRTVDVRELHKEVDKYSKQLRELDLKIQELNWTVEMVE